MLAAMQRLVLVMAAVVVVGEPVSGFMVPPALSLGSTQLLSSSPRALTASLSRTPSPLALRMQERPERATSRADSPASMSSSVVIASLLTAFPLTAYAAAPEWLEPTRSSLDIGLALFSLLFFLRIPLTWYPQMDLNKFPQNIVAWPTEPFCKLVRLAVPPLFGVDISPVSSRLVIDCATDALSKIVLYGVLSFIREIFLGQQGKTCSLHEVLIAAVYNMITVHSLVLKL
eukprot:741132-Hanusia_phi.AAC.4